ncbi:Uncharacterised protein [uncultured archaeon]|nr:Uncharacterised protein [uncultured archaeon]
MVDPMAVMARLIKSRKGNVLAMCDEGVLGKKYSEGKIVLDLIKHRGFYEGEALDESSEELKRMISEADSINAVGKRSVRLLQEFGYDVSAAKSVQKVPHLHVYKI